MRLGPEGQSVGAEFSVTSVKSPILSMVELVKQGYKFETDWVQDVERESQCGVGRCEKFSLGGPRSFHDAEGALNADGRFVAPVVDGLFEEPLLSSGPITRSFQTARAPRGSSAEYFDSSSPVEDMRKRFREL